MTIETSFDLLFGGNKIAMKKKDNLISMHGYLSLPVLVKHNGLGFTLFDFICLIYSWTVN